MECFKINEFGLKKIVLYITEHTLWLNRHFLLMVWHGRNAFTHRKVTGTEGTVDKKGKRRATDIHQVGSPSPNPHTPHYFSGNSSLSSEEACVGL